MAGAPTPTGVIIGGVTYPSGDLFSNNGQQYLEQNGQYYLVGGGGQLTPASASATQNLTQDFPGAAGTSDANDNINYSSLLPSASQLESFAPATYQQFGSVPYTQAATLNPAGVASTPNMQAATVANVAGPNASSVDLSQLPGALSSYEGDVQAALAPTFQQQQDALTANEADRGIFNSTAGLQLQNNLSGQQDAALASADEPLVSQFAGAYNTGQEQNSAQQQAASLAAYAGSLGAAQTNASNQQAANSTNYTGSQDYNSLVASLQQQAGLANQSATNSSNLDNASLYNSIVGGNTTSYNDFLNTLLTDQTNLSTGLASSVLNSYDPSQYSSLLSTGLTSAGSAYNSAYTAGSTNTAGLSSALGSLGGSLFGGGSAAGAGSAAAGAAADAATGADAAAAFADFA
jgi:hypothetical protein